MGGCSSKPQTAECPEVSLFQAALKTSDSSAHQTLESLFNQHGRDGEDLLEDAQTLHELLLHAVESKELPHCKNQSAGDMALTTENAENCTQTKQGGSMSNLIENDQEKGASNLEDSLPGTLAAGATDENCRKAEVTPLDSPQKVVENHIEGYGIVSNVAEENQEKAGKSKVFVPDFAEAKPQQAEECGLSKFTEENAMESESGSLDLEPKSDIQKISVSALPEYAEQEKRGGLNLGPKSDCLKNLEPNLLESLPTNDLQKIEALESMERKEATPQALEELAAKGLVKTGAMAMETSKMPKPDEKCEKNEKALQDEEVEEQSGKAMEGEKTEEDKKTEMHCAKEALKTDIDRHDGEKSELQNEKAMEAEPPRIQLENGQELSDQGKKATEVNTLSEKTEEAIKNDMQDEKAEEATSRKAAVQDEESMREDEKTGVQNERGFEGEVEKLQRNEDGKAMRMKNLAVNAQGEGTTGVQNERDLDGEVETSHRDEDGEAVQAEKLAVAQGEEITMSRAGTQHCEAEKLNNEKDAKATGPDESLIRLAMTEKGDDKSASDHPLGAKEEKKAVEPLEEHSKHIEAGNLSAAAEKSCMECVESKPNQEKPTEEGIDDANEIAHMETSKQSNEKGEDLKAME